MVPYPEQLRATGLTELEWNKTCVYTSAMYVLTTVANMLSDETEEILSMRGLASPKLRDKYKRYRNAFEHYHKEQSKFCTDQGKVNICLDCDMLQHIVTQFALTEPNENWNYKLRYLYEQKMRIDAEGEIRARDIEIDELRQRVAELETR